MGRAFEFRKERKFKRWAKMSKVFTKLGKEIVMAVKAGGPDPDSNAKLRTIIQNAKGAQMPKDRIEAAIKRATNKDEKDYEEIVYEGYGPHGIAVIVETSTDNTNRTVANVRSYFTKFGGSLGTSGSVSFMFDHKAVFRFAQGDWDMEELELELIDFGLTDIDENEGELFVYTEFGDFGTMQKALEEKGIEVISADFQRFPTTLVELNEEQEEIINKLIDKLEEDDDVNNVYTNMA
ncbi:MULTISPECIES: YebC/PmpR family DNA-binding transcriptional regulator [Algoriphagus]|jgi:YebC/PmpR family DNA-binding regulatory protein|uniref:Probable transcriptional regulatory protein KUV23_13275 n=3 Tax=Algoriphagus TaxID=246875 RepID=A0ABS7N7I9_9BACT|nr:MULTISPECIES: YebC/PmpR family DNA-binding transcriptional regulator [Algoriphagus]KPQ14398.1 MAG: YebC/PmpR family transcriptional regulator [Algoriphagus marincola HL-49]MBY5951955.1 YebC/PmpR family DNA-binding transcriptional regulator [Algoriphagus marincola]MCR9082723.1 YebC/PmpR family DNA-binding transcriptional regulator [Cyclobacteriaceae bacterium]TDK44331.1 YebC/PmpR family DNA-binding transcriptional regulator [Algoriphagus aquimaris]